MDGNKKITGIVCAAIFALAIIACKVQPTGYGGLYIDNLISVTDTTAPDVTPLNMVDTAMTRIDTISYQMIELQKQLAVLPDTSFPGENPQEFQPPVSLQTEVDFKQLIQDKNDAIVVLRNQLNELQNFGILQSDTVFKVRETVKSPNAESQQIYYLTHQLLRAMDEQNQSLQNQLNAIQNTTARTPQQTYITREPLQVQPLSSRHTDQLTLQMFQSQNDTIQFLRNQLRNLQLIEKETHELQPSEELVASDPFQELQNTIQLLRTRVQSLEEQTPTGKEAPTLDMQVEKDAPYPVKTDTTLLVAFYNRGERKPLEEESVLKQIKELCSNKNVTKITLSGFTDSSGSAIINKEITKRRLDYLSEMIVPWIAKEKISFQNFGDIFASEKMVSDERRIEIRILTL